MAAVDADNPAASAAPWTTEQLRWSHGREQFGAQAARCALLGRTSGGDGKPCGDALASFAKADMDCASTASTKSGDAQGPTALPPGDLDAQPQLWRGALPHDAGRAGEVKHWGSTTRRAARAVQGRPPPRRNTGGQDARERAAPETVIQNARTSGGGTWRRCRIRRDGRPGGDVEAERVSIWPAGNHDNPFGQRLTA